MDSGSEDLTSLSARQRLLTFEGMVYVEPTATDDQVLDIVRTQTRTAFGALGHASVSAKSREFANVDPAAFQKRTVKVIDTTQPNDAGRDMIEVRYTYKDSAIVAVDLSRKTSLALSLLGQGAPTQERTIIEQCSRNDQEVRDDADMDLLWYDFDPTIASCKKMMDREQATIASDTAKLSDPTTMVAFSRVNRVLLPVTMQLARADTATRATYPEYDRLFRGASEPGVLKIVLIDGKISHDDSLETRKDLGYYQWMDTLGVIFDANPDFELKKIEPEANIASLTAEGKQYDNLGFKDFIQWTVYGRGWPHGMPTSSRDDIAREAANKLNLHWVTFEKKVKVSIGGAAPTDLTIRLETYYGAEEDPTPHVRGIKEGDVFIYNGHSYLGSGPLDPSNYSADSFTGGYQLFWFDSCISYNYYDQDFFTLKRGGSQNLDIIVNGLEAPAADSGAANGYFINKLIGDMPSYQTLLASARATDSLRVVEGEIDNQYTPQRNAVRIVH